MSLSLFSAAALFTSLALNAAKSSIPFGRIKRHSKAWWSAEMEGAVSERGKAFAVAHKSDEDRQAYIFASQRASSVIAKAEAEAWQTTCSSLSTKSNPKTVYSLLRSIAGSSSSCSSSPSFPNCSSPRKSVSVYAAYLRSHFFVSQPKALRSRARGYLFELRRARCPEESHSSFCSPFTLAEFLVAASNHFERIILSRLLFFLESNSILSPRQAGFHPGRSTLDQILYLFQSISDGFNKPRPGSLTIFPTIDFSKAFDSVWHPVLFHKLISAGLPPCFARWTQSFLSDRRACVVYQNHKSFLSSPSRCSAGIRPWPCTFLSLHQRSSSFSAFFCQLFFFTLTIWPFGPPLPRSPQRWRPHKELCFDWSSGLIAGVFLSIRANVRPSSSHRISTKPTSSPISS